MNTNIENHGISPNKLINREIELELINSAFDALHKNIFLSTPIIDFFGIAGIGKTRILEEISEKCIATNVPCIKLDENQTQLDESQNTDEISLTILQQTRKYRQPSLKTPSLSQGDLRTRTVAALKALLKNKPVVILLDAIDTSNETLLDWLRMTLRDLLEHNNFFVVMTSKQQIAFENDWSVSRKLTPFQLKPLNLDASQTYLAALSNTTAPKIREFIFQWTRGYPSAMEVMTKAIIQRGFDIQKTEDKQHLITIIIDEIVDKKVFAHVTELARLNWYKAHFLLLSMPRRFNLVIMQELLEKYGEPPIEKLQKKLEYLGMPKQLNDNTGVLYWDIRKAAFTIDESIRNLFLIYQKLYNAPRFLEIHEYLAEKNLLFADKVTGTDRVRYLREYLYHSAQSLDTQKLADILLPTLEQIKNTAPDALVQFSVEFQQDNELKEILGKLGENVYTFVREHSTSEESPE